MERVSYSLVKGRTGKAPIKMRRGDDLKNSGVHRSRLVAVNTDVCRQLKASYIVQHITTTAGESWFVSIVAATQWDLAPWFREVRRQCSDRDDAC